LATVITTESERRKRLRLKGIVVSEHNYHALKRLGHAGESFNDMITKLLRIHRRAIKRNNLLHIVCYFMIKALNRSSFLILPKAVDCLADSI
jgi:predicted CopG family antitoxin